MAKLTLPCLLRRLQLVALQLQLQQQPQQQQQQQQQQQHPHGSHLMAMQLGQAVLLYGCLLLLHASVSASVLATSSDATGGLPALVNLSNTLDLNGSPTDQQKHEHLEKRPRKRDAANVPEDDEYGSYPDDVDELEALLNNKSGE